VRDFRRPDLLLFVFAIFCGVLILFFEIFKYTPTENIQNQISAVIDSTYLIARAMSLMSGLLGYLLRRDICNGWLIA
jgi:hypothetical protein